MFPGIKYKSLPVYKYQITENYAVQLKRLEGYSFNHKWFRCNKAGLFTVKAGAKFDGPSGITIDTENFMMPAAIHDFMYMAGRLGLIPYSMRKYADQVLYTLCRDQNMSWFRANYVFRAVRLGGKKSFTESRDE